MVPTYLMHNVTVEEKSTCAFANIGHHPSPTRHFFVTSKFSIFKVSKTAFSLLTYENNKDISLAPSDGTDSLTNSCTENKNNLDLNSLIIPFLAIWSGGN